MQNTINIVDSGNDKYLLQPDSDILGRMYDNESDTIFVNIPDAEFKRSCLMIVSANGKIIDTIPVDTDGTIIIKDNISMYPNVNIGFSFQDINGYVKGSEIKQFRFLPAPKPYFTPSTPRQKLMVEMLLKYGFTNSYLDNNKLVFENVHGVKVVEFDLSPFIQAQSDLGEKDSTKETFVNGKKLSNLEDDIGVLNAINIISEVQSSVNTLQTNVSDIKDDVSAIELNVSTLQERTQEIEQQLQGYATISFVETSSANAVSQSKLYTDQTINQSILQVINGSY